MKTTITTLLFALSLTVSAQQYQVPVSEAHEPMQTGK